MALLDKATREKYLKELGYADVKTFQASVMYPKWVDGVYGQQTDNALRTAWNVKQYTKNFKTKEFRCECGGRYCGGYPDYMKPSELIHIQTIRDHFNRPITITCGLRCKGYNRELNGSIANSLHLTGQALDFYQVGVTNTLANRKSAIRYIKGLPNHHYTYGNGINSYGNYVGASYMGNALHTDCYNSDSTQPDGKLNVDGKGGGCTVMAMQRFFKVTADGVISGQNASLGKYYPSLTAVEYGVGGSATIKALQKWVGTAQDGVLGQDTIKKWQSKLGVTADGYFGTQSMKAWQKYLNDNLK